MTLVDHGLFAPNIRGAVEFIPGIRRLEENLILEVNFFQRKNPKPNVYVKRLREILTSTWHQF